MNTTATVMSAPNFQFKQFTVWHEKCAMKVGTDGVLLGAWVNPHLTSPQGEKSISADNTSAVTVNRILDIGTGSGLIALMLAQRFTEAKIDAIDIDAKAAEQAAENFARSPWTERLHAEHASLQDIRTRNQEPRTKTGYDLIVSNPPYFVDSLKNPDKGRETARHTDSLSFAELVESAAAMLNDEGMLAVILPAEAETEIRRLCVMNGLTPRRICYVKTKATKPAKRVMIEAVKTKTITITKTETNTTDIQKVDTEVSTLCLTDGVSPRSEAYSALTQDFYL